MRTRIYISGPLTSSGEPRRNVDDAIDAWHALTSAGFACLCPHLSWFIDPENDIPHDVWMEVDLPWVACADALLRLPGESKGADIETRFAVESGIPVFHSIEALVESLS